MRLLIGTAIVFFGTLMAAGLVALGTPVVADFVAAHQDPMRSTAPKQGPLIDAQVARQDGTGQGRH
jgi:hypothetical protein